MLRIITGRSGGGKTREMLSLMAKSENAIYIVPEQYSFSAEKKITAEFGMSGMGYPTVYSFRRLAYYFEELYGAGGGENLAGASRVMVLGEIVRRISSSLSLFGGSAKRGDMANEAAVIITTFKQYGVTREKIERAIEKTENTLLKKKLNDCMLIAKEYEEFLKSGYRDSEDLLEGLCRSIEAHDYLDGKDVFIDSFQAFTPLEYSVICAMLNKCKSVTVALCAVGDGDEFVTAQRTKRSLERLCGEKGFVLGDVIELPGAMYTAHDALKTLEESFFDESAVCPGKVDTIHIHRAKDEYSEVVRAAFEIESLCRDKGYRYRDIVIIARETDPYEKSVSRVFDMFDIPFFMDKKTPLSSEAAAIFALSAIRIISRGWQRADLFTYMKSAFSPVGAIEACEVENYCLASGVRARDWKSDGRWEMPPSVKGETCDKDYLDRINKVKEEIRVPLIRLEEKIKGTHTGRELSVAFYEFLNDCSIEDKIDQIADKLNEKGESEQAMRTRQVYDMLIGTLECFDDAFSEKSMKAEDFLNILSTGIENVEIGVIPSNTDCVCIGSIDRARGHGAKAVIILGAKEGVFPAVPKETGVFTNADRLELSGYGIELPPDTLGKTYMEESLVYSALSCAAERLFVSYSVSGEGANPSIIIKRIKRVFPCCIETDEMKGNSPLDLIGSAKSTYENFVVAYSEYKKGKDVGDEWLTAIEFYEKDPIWKDRVKEIERHSRYSNRTEFIKSELLKARYGGGIETSVSNLERFSKCPFSYFAKVTLGLKERKALEVTAADSGTFLHEFVDLFGKQLTEDNRTWRDIDSAYINKKTEEITMELIGGLNSHMLEVSPRLRNLFIRLKRIAKRSVTTLSEHMKKGTFEPLGYEIVFDKNGDFKPLSIDLPNGERASLRGRIDRADILETKRGSFVRIIDYKSGEKKFSLSNIYYGMDLQLAIYLTALCEGENYHPAGMLYFKIDEPVIDRSDACDKESYERAAMKKLRMDGLVLEDDEILGAMDASYASGSDVIPVKKTTSGAYDAHSKVATESEFQMISKHAKSTVKKLCNEILSGANAISPVKGACAYCEMKTLCNFDRTVKGFGYRELEKINDKDALLKIIEEQKEKVQE
ncbi:MAG: PD-(D/E)XK nuclease family protein [Clostridia bacterium]|nr:PD-(D/E)XK nuclease family protein [Clostridia bacterium]